MPNTNRFTLPAACLALALACWAEARLRADPLPPPLAEASRQAERRRLQEADALLYAKRLALARREWQEGNTVRAREELEGCQRDMRGWEHRYLSALYRDRRVVAFREHVGAVRGVAFRPDGKAVASCGTDGLVRLWDPRTGGEALALDGHAELYAVGFTPDGREVLTVSGHRAMRVESVGSEVRPPFRPITLEGHDCGVVNAAFSPDGKRLATVGVDGEVKVWDAATGAGALSLKGHAGRVRALAFSLDGRRIATGGDDSTVKVWDALKGNELLSLKGHTGAITVVALSADGGRVASAGRDGTARMWDAARGVQLLSLKGHDGGVTAVALRHDARRVASGGRDGRWKVWDALKGTELLSVGGHDGAVLSLAFSPDGKHLATGGADRQAKLWDAGKGEMRFYARLWGHVRWLAFSPDGNRFAASSPAESLTACDVNTGKGDLRTDKSRKEPGAWPSAPTASGSPVAGRTAR